MTLRVAFIDDHDIVRSGFVQLLSLEADIQVVGEFSSAAQARRPAGAGGGNLHLRHFDARRQRVGSAGGHSLRHPRGDAVDARQPGAGGNGAGSRRQRLPLKRCRKI